MSKLAHSNDETMVQIETTNRIRRGEMEAITHDEWYEAQNQIGGLRAALAAIVKEATTVVDGHVYVPSGFQKVVSLAREALKTPNKD